MATLPRAELLFRCLGFARSEEDNHDRFHNPSLPCRLGRPLIKMRLVNAKRSLTSASGQGRSKRVCRQSVADANLRLDQHGRVAFGFEFLAQMRDVNAKVLCLALRLFSPNRAEELPVSNNLAGVLHKDAQERVFRRREFDLGAVELHMARREVDTEWSRVEDRLTRFG